jgi:hypothetical protein
MHNDTIPMISIFQEGYSLGSMRASPEEYLEHFGFEIDRMGSSVPRISARPSSVRSRLEGRAHAHEDHCGEACAPAGKEETRVGDRESAEAVTRLGAICLHPRSLQGSVQHEIAQPISWLVSPGYSFPQKAESHQDRAAKFSRVRRVSLGHIPSRDHH